MRRLSWLLLLMLVLLAGMAGCSQRQTFGPGNPEVSNNASSSQAEAPVDNSTAIPGSSQPAPTPSTSGQAENAPVPLQTDQPAAATDTAKLIISKNFGTETLVAKQAPISSGCTIIDLLNANTSIATKWDGSFINSINGLAADDGGLFGEKKDWFYFVNGICADVGASGYTLQTGETVWWDYHPWKSMGSTNSAVIGCYPEPFIHGYRGQIGTTVIMAAADSQELAARLQTALKNRGAAARVMELNNDYVENRSGPVMVVGTWNQLKQLPWLAGLNEAYRKTGLSVYFKDGSLDLLDYKGGVAKTVTGSAGIIGACGSGLGDASPVWLLAGTDQAGVQQAVDTLVNNPQAIRQFFNAAIADGQIIRLPLQ